MGSSAKKVPALLLALLMTAGLLGGCVGKPAVIRSKESDLPTLTFSEDGPEAGLNREPTQQDVYRPTGNQLVDGKEYGIDYISLYDQFGAGTSIKDVTEDPETGLVYLNAPDGKQYELGLDFLSMAMVYNTDLTGSVYDSEEDVYAAWWRYYVTRWNLLLPEIPLYCNEYYDIFSAEITGVEEHPTNPYWSPARALLYWASEKEDNSLILGSTGALAGKFRYPAYGEREGAAYSENPGDWEIYRLITGLDTVVTDREGRYLVNPTAVKAFETTENEDGTVTYTITLYDDMKFSDGSPVTAKNYLYMPMVFSSYLAKIGIRRVPWAFRRFVGYDDYQSYNGWDEAQAYLYPEAVGFEGLRLLGDFKFSVTVAAEYVPFFFSLDYVVFSPTHRDLWVGNGDIADDGEGCYFTEGFYAEGEALELPICINAIGADPSIPCAGPYVPVSWDENAGRVILRRNPYFKGNYEGVKPSIETVIWQRVGEAEQLSALTEGQVDYLSDITLSSTEKSSNGITDLLPIFSIFDKSSAGSVNDLPAKVISTAESSDGAFLFTHYSRAGYGKLAFRCDFGPVQFPEVRQAIALCMDRTAFADEYTGGLGGIVDGPYYTGSWMYKAAVRQGMTLDPYTTSPEEAVRVLEEGGWIYDKDGKPYTQGVRYKKIPGEYATETDILYKSPDGEYVTAKVGDDYYMPLVLNWFGSEENSVTPVLERRFEQNELLAAAGFQVEKRIGPFQIMFDEFYQNYPYSGFWQPPSYNVFNFAANFDDPGYDCSFKMTVDPDMYDNYSAYFFKDPADLYWKE